jgi:hypothetical protein
MTKNGDTQMMKAVTLAVAILASGTMVARAQDRVIIDVPGVRITPPRVDEGRDRPAEKRVIETERGRRGGCETKSVTRSEPGETKTVTKETCGGS